VDSYFDGTLGTSGSKWWKLIASLAYRLGSKTLMKFQSLKRAFLIAMYY
jgi:hypothetical protein